MKKIVVTLFMSLALSECASALANNGGPAATGLKGETQTPAPQSAELAEADSLSRSIVELHKAGKDDEALVLANRVLALREKALGPDDRQVAFALFNLGELYVAKRKYGTAQPFYKRALTILEKDKDKNNEIIGKVLNSLALVSYLDRDFGQSETFYQRLLEHQERTFGAGSHEVARALFNLAELYRRLSKYEKAEPLFLRMLAIEEKLLKPDDPNLEKAQERYVCLLYEKGDEKKADELSRRYSESRASWVPGTLIPEVLNGKALSLPRPEYPQEARNMRASGVVIVKVKIDEAGKVIESVATCGNPYLVRASEAAASKARFTPTLKAGQPVQVTGIITYRFLPQ
ncbi:MAG TPA: TonB family protein [Pyrinomonadaceae bacterium]|jgi:TonB family protein